MGIQNFSEDVVLVVLPEEPQLGNELAATNEIISGRSDCDIVIDFSKVQILTSSSIGNLIILHKMLCEHGRQLVLCNVTLSIKCIFRVAGLEDFFNFADDKYAALASMQHNS